MIEAEAQGYVASRPRPSIRISRLLIVVLCTFVTACEWVPVRTFDRSSDHTLSMYALTRDANDGHTTAATKGTFSARALATNTGTNTRQLIYPGSQPVSTNHQSCATWQAQDGFNTQQGLALRVRHDVDQGRWRAITVTKNVVWGANWQLNVTTWDSHRPGWQKHGSIDLAAVFWPNQVLAPFPWRVCARVEADIVRVKGWRIGQAEPAWADPVHSGAVRVPAEWVYAGKAGWYLGHLAPGHSATMTDLVLDRLEIR